MGTCISISTKLEKSSNGSKSPSCMGAMKKTLKSITSPCWVELGERRKRRENSDRIKFEEEAMQTSGRATTPVLPLWQRRILMGEKCELPRFSGLILYDECGFPLRRNSLEKTPTKEKHATAMIAIKDLL